MWDAVLLIFKYNLFFTQPHNRWVGQSRCEHRSTILYCIHAYKHRHRGENVSRSKHKSCIYIYISHSIHILTTNNIKQRLERVASACSSKKKFIHSTKRRTMVKERNFPFLRVNISHFLTLTHFLK